MKKKLLLIGLMLGLFSILFTNILSTTCGAANDDYHISIKDKKATYLRELTKAGNTYVYYDISVTLYNSGTDPSTNMTMKLREENFENLTSRKEIIINPSQYYTHVFEDFFVIGKHEQDLYIEYYPTHQDYRTKYNSGETTIKLHETINEDENSTPGFEIIVLISAIFLYLALYKRNNIRL